MIYEHTILKNGISGIMRVKNDAQFIEASIDSCIDALDELVIVYNDCSDNSPELIEKKRRQYPDKIKVYEYKYKVYSVNLTEEEYLYAKSLPFDSPHLLCNYYNFALSKVSYKYAMKIDADQLYFTEKLKILCDMCRETVKNFTTFQAFLGIIYWLYIKIFVKISEVSGKVFPIVDNSILRKMKVAYMKYIHYKMQSGKVCMSLSGINVVNLNNKWYVSLGRKDLFVNILPPYNGVGDHLIFKVGKDTFYRPFDCSDYNMQSNSKYSYIESFALDVKTFPVGTCWFHLNAMRPAIYEKICMSYKRSQNSFIELDKFINIRDFYRKIIKLIDRNTVNAQRLAFYQVVRLIDGGDNVKNEHYITNCCVDKYAEN